MWVHANNGTHFSFTRSRIYRKCPKKNPYYYTGKGNYREQREKSSKMVNKTNRWAHTGLPVCIVLYKRHLESWRPALTQVLYLSRHFIAFALTSAVFSQSTWAVVFSFFWGETINRGKQFTVFVGLLLCFHSLCYFILMLDVLIYIRKRLHYCDAIFP